MALTLALGCMRLSTDADRDGERAVATIRAAAESGISIFDTAHAYGLGADDMGHNERLLAEVLRDLPVDGLRILTKGGMRRPDGAWEPDGRARTIREDAERSLVALRGLPIDTFFLHAPDPRVSWATSVRALDQVQRAGLVRRLGLSNVTRTQLDQALEHAAVSAVQVALGPFSDAPLRGGLVSRCLALGIEVFAHSPLGGPARASRLGRDATLAAVAERHGTSAQRVALAAIAAIGAGIVPIVGSQAPRDGSR